VLNNWDYNTPSQRYTSDGADTWAFAYNVSFSSKVVSKGSDSGFTKDQQGASVLATCPCTHRSTFQELHHIKILLYIRNLLTQALCTAFGIGLHELIFPEMSATKRGILDSKTLNPLHSPELGGYGRGILTKSSLGNYAG
jgi:hypothetical protein